MNKEFNSRRYSDAFKIGSGDSVRLSQVLSLMGTNKKVLDLGCGDGFFMEKFKEAGNDVIGVEVATSAIEKARDRGFKVYDFLLESNWSSHIDEKFDVVFAGEIIEHVFDTDNFLKNVSNVLKDEGFIIITTPNIASLARRLLLLFGRNPFIETTAREYDAGHIRYFTRASLLKLLDENDFRVADMTSSIISFSNNTSSFFSCPDISSIR